MKKYMVNLLLLFVVHNCYAMELAKLSPYIFFINNYKEFYPSDKEIRQCTPEIKAIIISNVIRLHRDYKEVRCINDKFFNAGVKRLNDKLDEALLNGSLVRDVDDFYNKFEGYLLSFEKESISFKVLISYSFYQNVNPFVTDMWTHANFKPNEQNGSISFYSKDVRQLTLDSFNLLENMVKQHNSERMYKEVSRKNGIATMCAYYGANPYKVNEASLQKIQDFPEVIKNNKIFKELSVGIEDKLTLTDKVLIHGPMLINSIMPDAIFYYVSDIAGTIGCNVTIAGTLGMIASVGASYATGEYILPRLDNNFNSYMALVKACIQKDKIKGRGGHGELFFITNVMQNILSFVGNKFLSIQSLPAKLFGGIVHLIRIPIFFGIYDWVVINNDLNKHAYKMSDLKLEKENQ